MNDRQTGKQGIGFFGLLQLVFIVLKLVGVIAWKWVLVLLPAIISGGIILLLIIIAALIAVKEGR